MIQLPAQTSLWEATAAIQLVQTHGHNPEMRGYGEVKDLLACAILPESSFGGVAKLELDAAYRGVDISALPYTQVLALVSSWCIDPVQEPPKFRGTVSTGGGIIVCPFAPKKEIEVPLTVWRALVRVLRSYNLPVHLLGAKGQWYDDVAFTEGEVLSERSVHEKLAKVAASDLVIGVPNEWLWAAAGFTKSLVVLYPDGVPNKRWFHYSNDKFGRIVYSPQAIDVPRMLAGLVQLIKLVG